MTNDQPISIEEAARLLGEGMEARHVHARILRGSLRGERTGAGWSTSLDAIEQTIAETPVCGACDEPATVYVIVKYPHHERVEFSLCSTHGAEAELSYGRQGHVIEVISYPYQSEGWLKPRPPNP